MTCSTWPLPPSPSGSHVRAGGRPQAVATGTFCKEESSALSALDKAQEKLIRDDLIERIFKNFPEHMKGTLLKQYGMLQEIGKFISKHFYNNGLDHSRTEGNGLFEHFAWPTYDSKEYFAP
ncbi:C-terminal helicase domain-containing protein [Pseudomonas syringae pv. actinidiae]|nr:C-terminal helicase domain-containing protein [Pseudomonas syringae]MDG6385031.1 C-terminal helicase domain-containing protein [Pseudomonas syringae]MDU8488892.1 C-terminal helicase domain-containing protein [Pseudomonas syringae pv. actinidiae]